MKWKFLSGLGDKSVTWSLTIVISQASSKEWLAHSDSIGLGDKSVTWSLTIVLSQASSKEWLAHSDSMVSS